MFQFKHFTIDDSGTAMKVGTDGVLLGAWADVEHDSRILDVGTGSGIIAIMAAQRNAKARITALDIDADAVAQDLHILLANVAAIDQNTPACGII